MSEIHSPSMQEMQPQSPEVFLEHDRAKQIVVNTLLAYGRIDEEGVAQPLEVFVSMSAPGILYKQLDSEQLNGVVVPEREQLRQQERTGDVVITRSVDWDSKDAIYAGLTGQETYFFDNASLDLIEHPLLDMQKSEALNKQYDITLDTKRQSQDAVHISNHNKAKPEFEDIRFYIPGGLQTTQILKSLIEHEADFAHAKAWIPKMAPGEQRFRKDAPIIIARTYEQLQSVSNALRQMYQSGELQTTSDQASLVGMTIEDLPGVTIGQVKRGGSFNNAMAGLFADAFQRAAEGPVAGDRVTDDWIDKTASKMAQYAQSAALEHGRDPHNHAFLTGQPVDKILAAIAS